MLSVSFAFPRNNFLLPCLGLSHPGRKRQRNDPSRRRLTLRTIKATPPCHNPPPNRRLAPETSLALASVRFMMLLIPSRHPPRVNKIRYRRPAHHNRFLQNFLQPFA